MNTAFWFFSAGSMERQLSSRHFTGIWAMNGTGDARFPFVRPSACRAHPRAPRSFARCSATTCARWHFEPGQGVLCTACISSHTRALYRAHRRRFFPCNSGFYAVLFYGICISHSLTNTPPKQQQAGILYVCGRQTLPASFLLLTCPAFPSSIPMRDKLVFHPSLPDTSFLGLGLVLCPISPPRCQNPHQAGQALPFPAAAFSEKESVP